MCVMSLETNTETERMKQAIVFGVACGKCCLCDRRMVLVFCFIEFVSRQDINGLSHGLQPCTS